VPEGIQKGTLTMAIMPIITVLIQLLLVLLVLAIVYYIAKLACTHFGAPPVILQIIGLILLLVFLVAILNMAAGIGPRWRFN
jgi:hypothetical protein